MIKLKINDVETVYKDGLNITELYNETLDTGVLVIPQTVELEIEPLDEVKIYSPIFVKEWALSSESYFNSVSENLREIIDIETGSIPNPALYPDGYALKIIDGETIYYLKLAQSESEGEIHKRMLISVIDTKISKWESPREYNYTIGLVSPVIKLQRIVLPNRTITKSLVSAPKTIKYYMESYLEIYAPEYSLSGTLASLVENVICPEMQWNTPTLYEVFNDLLAIVNCVVTMSDFNTIHYLDLNLRGNNISENNLSNIETSRSVEDYVSDLEIEAKNVVPKEYNCHSLDYITLRTTDGGTITKTNWEIILEHSIFKITKCYMKHKGNILDITVAILEKSKYDLLKTSNEGTAVDGAYKRNFCYYTEGDNVIRGLSYGEQNYLPAPLDYTYYAIYGITRIGTSVTEGAWSYFGSLVIDATVAIMSTIGFYFEYTTLEDVKFRSTKTHAPKHTSVLTNNQANAYTNIELLAKNQNQTVNRLGNETIRIYGKYDSLGEVPALADTYDTDYILMSRTYAIYDSIIEFTGELSKDYIRKNLFTGIKSKRRYTQLASAKDSAWCNHLTVYKYRFSFTETETSLNNEKLGYSIIIMSLIGYFVEIAALTFNYKDTTSSALFAVPISCFFADKHALLSISLRDNFEVGKKIETKSYGVGGVSYFNSPAAYTDTDGEFDSVKIELYERVDNEYLDSTDSDEYDDAVDILWKYPEITTSELKGKIFETDNLTRYKDNREITNETIQLTVLNSLDNNIIMGNFFLRPTAVYVYASTTAGQTYRDGDTVCLGTKYTNANCYYEISDYIKITITDGTTPPVWANVTSWAIGDNDRNMILGVNGNTKIIYLNKE